MDKFKVGDKVRVLSNSGGGVWEKGYVGVVTKIDWRNGILEVDGDATKKGWYIAEDLELVYTPKDIKEPDAVNHPSHYNESGIECVEAIRASLGKEFPAYCKGNVMKYLWRYQYKNGLEDLKKAQVYLGWMIEYMETDK